MSSSDSVEQSESPVDAGGEGALDGLRVLDFSTRVSGAFCARLLADFGADVVLVEPPGGTPLRQEPPFVDGVSGPEASLVHAYCNANKRAVLLPDDDHDRRARLLEWADLVVTTHADPAIVLNETLPERVVHVSVTPHGLGTPHTARPGVDLTAAAMSGWAAMGGTEGEPPLKGPQHQVGYLSGLSAFVGAVAAVIAQDRGGRGDLVDVSELETLALIAGPSIVAAAYDGSQGRRPDGSVFTGPVPVQDGYASVTFSRAHFWRDAMNMLGLPELAEDPRYIDSHRRREHQATLRPIIEGRLAGQGRWDVFDMLTTVRCVAGVVLDMADLGQNEHLAARDFFVETEVAGRSVRMPGAPFKMSRTPWRHARPSPALSGEASL